MGVAPVGVVWVSVQTDGFVPLTPMCKEEGRGRGRGRGRRGGGRGENKKGIERGEGEGAGENKEDGREG